MTRFYRHSIRFGTSRAFTMVEVLVVMLILILAIGVVGALFLWALDGTAAGAAQQLTQQDARTVVEDLRGDIGMSVIPPVVTGTGLPVPSSVLIPSGYQNVPNSSSNDIYTSPSPTLGTATELVSENIVAITVPNPAQSSSTFIPTLLQDQNGNPEFALVVYYVSDSTGLDVTQYRSFDASGNPVPSSAVGVSETNPTGRSQATESGHILWKAVYNVNAVTGSPLVTAGTVDGWTVDFGSLNGPNGHTVSLGASTSDPVSQDSVVTLNSGDSLEFLVHHPITNDAGDLQAFGTECDRHSYQFDVVSLREVHLHLGQVHSKSTRMSDSATIRTFQ